MLDLDPAVAPTARAEPVAVEGFDAVRLRSSLSGPSAVFVPRAGMVAASLRDADAELLWPGAGLRRYAGGDTTMGLPLLHPWANRLTRDSFAVAGRRVEASAGGPPPRDERGLAIHGLLGGSPLWRRVPGPDLHAELDFGAHPRLLAAFPFPHRLRLDIALRGRTLRIATTLTPTAGVAVPVAFGFHPYFQLPGVPRARWRVELPGMDHLEADGRGIPTGRFAHARAETFWLADRSFDDGYVGVAQGARFVVAGGGRRITVRLEEGFPVAQVFAPRTAPVICFEPMTAPTNALVSGDRLAVAAPGEAYRATFSITVDPCA